jgi:hypothetical protein
LVLGASFLCFALAAFDFRLPRWLALASCAAIGVLALIFLMQGAADLLASAQLREIAYDVLGQGIEKILGYGFLLWCLAVLVLDSSGITRALGIVVLATIALVDAHSAYLALQGQVASDALKLAYLPVFVWLLAESAKARTAP